MCQLCLLFVRGYFINSLVDVAVENFVNVEIQIDRKILEAKLDEQ